LEKKFNKFKIFKESIESLYKNGLTFSVKLTTLKADCKPENLVSDIDHNSRHSLMLI